MVIHVLLIRRAVDKARFQHVIGPIGRHAETDIPSTAAIGEIVPQGEFLNKTQLAVARIVLNLRERGSLLYCMSAPVVDRYSPYQNLVLRKALTLATLDAHTIGSGKDSKWPQQARMGPTSSWESLHGCGVVAARVTDALKIANLEVNGTLISPVQQAGYTFRFQVITPGTNANTGQPLMAVCYAANNGAFACSANANIAAKSCMAVTSHALSLQLMVVF